MFLKSSPKDKLVTLGLMIALPLGGLAWRHFIDNPYEAALLDLEGRFQARMLEIKTGKEFK